LVETYIGGKGKGLLLVETCYARSHNIPCTYRPRGTTIER